MPNFSQKISISFFKSSRDVFTVIGFSIKKFGRSYKYYGEKNGYKWKAKIKTVFNKNKFVVVVNIWDLYSVICATISIFIALKNKTLEHHNVF